MCQTTICLLCIHPVKGLWQKNWYCVHIQIAYPEDVLSQTKQPVITWGEIGNVAREYQRPSAPDFARNCGVEVLHCPWSIMTPLSRSSSCLRRSTRLKFSCKSARWYWPFTVLPLGTEWSSVSPFRLKNRRAWLTERPDCAVQFYSWTTFGHAIQHSVFFSWGSNEWINYSPTVKIRLSNALLSFLQRCRWLVTRGTRIQPWPSLNACGIHIAETFPFPKLFGEDTVNTRWWDSDSYSSCRVRSVVCEHSRTDFTFSMWRSSVADDVAALRDTSSLTSRQFLMTPIGEEFHMKKYVSLNVTSTICNTLEQSYPTKHGILLTFLRPSARNFICSHSGSIDKQQLTSQWQYTFVTEVTVSPEPHTCSEFDIQSPARFCQHTQSFWNDLRTICFSEIS